MWLSCHQQRLTVAENKNNEDPENFLHFLLAKKHLLRLVKSSNFCCTW